MAQGPHGEALGVSGEENTGKAFSVVSLGAMGEAGSGAASGMASVNSASGSGLRVCPSLSGTWPWAEDGRWMWPRCESP